MKDGCVSFDLRVMALILGFLDYPEFYEEPIGIQQTIYAGLRGWT